MMFPPAFPGFEEDTAVCRLAEKLGLALTRVETIEVFNQGQLAEAGLMRMKPDYPAIRKALKSGQPVDGARLGGVEYVLRRRA